MLIEIIGVVRALATVAISACVDEFQLDEYGPTSQVSLRADDGAMTWPEGIATDTVEFAKIVRLPSIQKPVNPSVPLEFAYLHVGCVVPVVSLASLNVNTIATPFWVQVMV